MKQKSKKRRKVLVAMSGGIDSSVVAALLVKKGYECIGIYLNFWSDPTVFEHEKTGSFPQNKCCSIESLNTARRIAAQLKMPFYVLNTRERFKKQIVDYFIDTYKVCQTPNPCVECNRQIKFGFLLERMQQLGADYVATGHFARIKKKKKKGETVYELWMGKDKTKDQSYFLYTLGQEKLKHIMFPVGDMLKTEVRKEAKKMGFFEILNRKESQGICFFPDKQHTDFLKRYFPKSVLKKGVIETTDGKKIGTHKGLQFFTVGQRKGIEIGGEAEPLYVIRLDYKRNTLIVGRDREAFQKDFSVHKLSFTEEELKDGEYTLDIRIRYRFPPQKAKVIKKGKNAEINFKKPQRAITPGQSVVFYNKQRVLGGGIIKNVKW
jgi:tRNA-specific 2-thiouridylase